MPHHYKPRLETGIKVAYFEVIFWFCGKLGVTCDSVDIRYAIFANGLFGIS